MEIEFRDEPGQRYPALYKDGVQVEQYKGQTSRGRVWIFDEYVLKLDGSPIYNEPNPDLYDDGYGSQQSLQEYLFLAGNRIAQDDRVHFPKVYTAGVWDEEGSGLCVWVLMERIRGENPGYGSPEHKVMRKIADRYMIEDMHDKNWLVDCEGTPIFLDVGYHGLVGELREAA